jgi:hypothetical protein
LETFFKLRGGGPSGHKRHRTGEDVDFRPLRTDAAHLPTNISDPSYGESMTKSLITFIEGFTLDAGVKLGPIFFNDPTIPGVRPCDGHDNHFHVRFSVTCQ